MGTASQAVVAGSPDGSRLQFLAVFPKMAVVLVGMDPETTKWTKSQAEMTRICRGQQITGLENDSNADVGLWDTVVAVDNVSFMEFSLSLG
jgi:hypothetical protein